MDCFEYLLSMEDKEMEGTKKQRYQEERSHVVKMKGFKKSEIKFR